MPSSGAATAVPPMERLMGPEPVSRNPSARADEAMNAATQIDRLARLARIANRERIPPPGCLTTVRVVSLVSDFPDLSFRVLLRLLLTLQPCPASRGNAPACAACRRAGPLSAPNPEASVPG